MYTVSKRLEISASHCVKTDYQSKCNSLHGHNWIVTVHCRSKQLNANGMVVDFLEIKQKVHGVLDHSCLNDVLPFNPTSENIAHWICEQIPSCYKVEIQETEGNTVIYEED